ncbi:ABC transporter ATP-binding protein [Haploplasma axanthum]|nr:ABC transporter ATP-binding protein [Haploplasma axanthum]
MKLIFKYLMRRKRFFFLNLFAILAVASAELGIPLLISKIIDDALPNGNLPLLYKFGIYLALVAILGAIGNILANYASVKTATSILVDLRNDVFKKIQTFSPEEMNEFGISSLITRTTSDVFQILNFVSTFFRTAFMSPILIAISIVLISREAPTLLPSTLISIPIVVIGIVIVITATKPLSESQQLNLDKLNLVTRENLTGVRVVRAFRKNKYEAERFEKANEKYTSTAMKLFRIMTSTEPVFFFFLNVIITITLFFAGQNVTSENPNLTLGNITAFFDYQFLVMFSILTFSMLFILYPRTIVSSKRIAEILNTDVKIKNKPNAISYIEKPKGTLEFKNVSFSYPDSEAAVLKDISFKAKKGETIAFIGSTGSGKSTLINLVPRLYDATEGEILIDDVNVTDFDLKYLRNKVGFIPQKAILFNGTIADNIRYGKHDATEEEVIEAAKTAQAHDFILAKQKGYDDPVSEMGANLSGGQKQRISIARALIKKPDVLIFDDSFSALDFKTDAALRKSLNEVSKDTITLVVAQRITSIVHADTIIVLNNGEIVCRGTHSELMTSCKIYQEIAASQLSEEELQ